MVLCRLFLVSEFWSRFSLRVFILFLYTASKVKHHLNIFLEKKTVKISKYEFILVTCLKRDKVVTIYSNF